MAKDDHWFKFYYRLIILSCQGWKDDEFGAYVKLLIYQFDKGGLPDSPAELAKLISSYKKNWPLLSFKFKKGEDGLLRNDFMKKIRDERDAKSVTASENGKTGGRGNKKQNESISKAKAFKNESNVLSTSYSPSSSVVDRDSLKGEEEVTLSKFGFVAKTLDKSMVLTDMEIGTTIEYLRIKSKKVMETREIVEQWEAFKIKTFGLDKWYNNHQELINHFRDSLKVEINNGTDRTTNSGSKQKSSNGKSAGASKLVDILRDEIGGAGPG